MKCLLQDFRCLFELNTLSGLNLGTSMLTANDCILLQGQSPLETGKIMRKNRGNGAAGDIFCYSNRKVTMNTGDIWTKMLA